MANIYAVLTPPGSWPDDLMSATVHQHAGHNGVRTFDDGRLLVEIRTSAISIVEKTFQESTFKVAKIPAAADVYVDVLRTRDRQRYLDAIARAQTMQDGDAGLDGTPMNQSTLESLLDSIGVDHSGFTTPVQYRVAYARSLVGSHLGPPNLWTTSDFSNWLNAQTAPALAGYAWEREIDIHNIANNVTALYTRIGEETGHI